MDRYSFLVRLLPPLLHAGLARRTNIPISLIEGIVVKRPVFASSIGKAAAPDFSVAVFVVIQL